MDSSKFIVDSKQHPEEGALIVRIREVLKDVGFVIVQNYLDRVQIQKEVDAFKAAFDSANDIRRSGPYYPDMPNFQRLDVGDYAQCNARFSRMFTFFDWNEGGLIRSELEKLIQLRDRILNLKSDGHKYPLENGMGYNLPKMLQYPRGGGFMNCHIDGVEFKEEPVFNCLVCLCRRGVDYERGGGYYYTRDDEFVDVEALVDIGDIAMHSLDIKHGVNSVDDHLDLDLGSMSGRIVINLSLEEFAEKS